jgi:alkylated DNA nucleotide flippase Atl1
MRSVSLPTPIAERVLDLVARIPPGRVMAYGDIAAYFADEGSGTGPRESGGSGAAGARGGEEDGADGPGRLGPRQVGRIMARFGGGVPWWRVLRADGTHAPGLEEGLRRLRAEGAPMRADGTRVDMAKARWDGTTGGGSRRKGGPDGS